jgi:type VI protein secretion system component Hcp
MAITYLMLIDGISGNTEIPGFENWIKIDDFDIDLATAAGSGSGGGGSGSKVTASPLTVSLSLAGVLDDLTTLIVGAKHIKSLQIVGINQDNDIVYDLRLGSVLVKSISEQSGNNDLVSFAFDRIGLKTFTLDSAGVLISSSEFGRDILANKAIDPDDILSPVPATADGGGVQPTKYFLLIDGFNGGSLDEHHKGWFEIGSFDFGLSTDITVVGGHSTAEKAAISQLTVALKLVDGLPGLLTQAAEGNHFASIEVHGVTSGKVVYDLLLGNVLLNNISQTTQTDTLTFDYTQIGLVTKKQNDDGSLADAGVFGYDFKTKQAILPSSIDAPEVGGTSGGIEPTKYFMAISGVTGNSVREHHENWIELDGFDIDIGNIKDILSGGGTTDRAALSPLHVTTSLSGILDDLLAKEVGSGHIQALEIHGLNHNGDVVYDLRLGDVLVTKVVEGKGGGDNVTFVYDQIGLKTKIQTPTGALADGGEFGFDTSSNLSIDPDTIATPSVPAGEHSVEATKFFLSIDGLKGGSTDDAHKDWFEIDNFNFDVSTIPSAGGATGGATGKADFSPLSVDVSLISGLPGLLHNIADGTSIPAIQLHGVGPNGNVVYDLRLAGVHLIDLEETSGVDKLQFDYDQFGLITKGQLPSGAPGAEQKFGFDILGNKVITDFTTIPLPSPGGAGGATGASKYFLSIDGIKGNSVLKGHEGWIEITGFDLDIENLLSGSGGGGSGKPDFSPLVVKLGLAGLFDDMLDGAATGKIFDAVQIHGLNGQNKVVYDLRLAEVHVNDVRDTDGSGDSVSFVYDRIGLITKTQKQDGTLAIVDKFGFDVSSRVERDPEDTAFFPLPSIADKGGGTEPTKYFLLIDGLKGGSTDKDHKNWFDISGYNVEISNNFTAQPGQSTKVFKPVFSLLDVSMNAETGLADFFRSVSAEKNFKSMQIEGVAPDGTVVHELRLGNVVVRDVHATGSVENISLDYGQIGAIEKFAAGDGSVTPVGQFGFNVTAHSEIDPLAIPEPQPQNDAPVATADAYSAALGQTLHVANVGPLGKGVLANDTDADGDALSALLQSATTDGVFAFNADGSYDFKPFFKGPSSFTYKANDGGLDSNVTTATITTALDATTLDQSASTVNTAVTLSPTAGASFTFITGVGKQTLADGINNVIGGSGNDTIRGSNSGGILNGGAGNDSLTGGTGVDYLIGGTGTDRLTGGANDDVFIFRPGFGADTVVDFTVGTLEHHDLLDLRGLGIGSVAELLNNLSSAANHVDSGPSAVIHAGADSVTLLNVTKAALLSHQFDILV